MIRSDQHRRWKVLPNVDYGRDLDALIPGAPNFRYGEVVESATAVKYGIKNIPTEAEWKRAEAFARTIAQPLRNKCGKLSASSWFRCVELNSHPSIGGSDKGFHPTGGGSDLEPQQCSLMELLEEAYKLPEWAEIIAEHFPNGWVHIGWIAGDNRRKLKLKDKSHHFTRVTLDGLRAMYGEGVRHVETI